MFLTRKLATALGAGCLVVALAGPARAQISDDIVKIGVLSDQSGLYSDITGQGSVIAAQMS
jgi:branched-chain amino acid transport system substrate-binding protein